MKRLLRFAVVWMICASGCAFAKVNYFPADAFGDEFLREWFSTVLLRLNEPSLYERSKPVSSQSYRFLWIRAFHHPVSIRFDVGRDGIAVLTVKVASGNGGPSPGHLIENRTRRITKERTAWFLGQINALEFWTLRSRYNSQPPGPDGAEWVIEGIKDGNYIVVSRSPPENGAVRSLGLALALDLANLKIPSKEIY
jgi:hypothetical protein